MACNCIKERIKYIKEHYKDSDCSFKDWQLEDVRFKHTDELIFTDLNIPVVIEGKNSKGNKAKKQTYYPAKYCPFCGKSYRDEKEGDING